MLPVVLYSEDVYLLNFNWNWDIITDVKVIMFEHLRNYWYSRESSLYLQLFDLINSMMVLEGLKS